MERASKITSEEISGGYDPIDDKLQPHPHADALALADALLQLKTNPEVTFVDIVMDENAAGMYEELRQGPLVGLLADEDDQLALSSDGRYYPILDIRKRSLHMNGMSLRVFGWGDATDVRDTAYQLELMIGYSNEISTVTESILLDVSSVRAPRLSSQVWVSDYADTGYEGHGDKHIEASATEVEWLLQFVARHVGDTPKSIDMVIHERLDAIRANAERHGVRESVDRLVDQTWEAQALYLMNRRMKRLGGQAISDALASERGVSADIQDAIDLIIDAWRRDS